MKCIHIFLKFQREKQNEVETRLEEIMDQNFQDFSKIYQDLSTV